MRKYALLVGIEEYRDPEISALKFARADAEALADRLKAVCGFDETRVLVGTGGPDAPDLLNILNALKDMAGELRREDLFLLFFAGHGIERDGRGYLLTRESSYAFPEHTSLSLDLLRKSLERFPAGRRIVVVDACRNCPDAARGDAGNVMGDAISRDIVAAVRLEGGGATTAFLSACSAGQRAYEWPSKGHGVFTYYVLEGIDGAAWRGDELEFDDLAEHAHTEVVSWRSATAGACGEQTPWYEKFGAPARLTLAKRQAARKLDELSKARPDASADIRKAEEAELKRLEAELTRAESGSDLGAKGDSLIARIADLRKKRTELLQSYTEQSSVVKKVDDEIAAAQSEIPAAARYLKVKADESQATYSKLLAEYKPAHPKMKELAEEKANRYRQLYALAGMMSAADAKALGLEPKVAAGFHLAPGAGFEPYTGTGWAAAVVHERTGIEMVFLPAGEFQMGSPESESGRGSDEGPLHTVRISTPFYLGRYEVIQGEWQKVMAKNPSHFKGDRNPVECVSWNDCQDFLKKAGDSLRLPTEAEWEYACRAGTTTVFYLGDTISTDQANYDGNYTYGSGRKGVYRERTVEVGSFPANAWGLCDMHGNVWEWCADWYGPYAAGSADDSQGPSSGTARLLRGGSWGCYPRFCRSADRYGSDPTGTYGNGGFRVARGL